nr:methylated-DNA--[protein]-cysteine S-methyltransferase [Derxia gummosa]
MHDTDGPRAIAADGSSLPAAPAHPHAALVADLCRHIDAAETPPTLAELSARAGLSAWHLQRVFKAVTGLSPKAWTAARRAARVRDELAGGASVTEAFHAAGYGSSGRFYEAADAALGMAPGRYRAGAPRTRIRFAVAESSLGAVLVAATDLGICAILLGDDPAPLVADLQRRFPAADLVGGDDDFERTVATVIGFVEAPRLGLDLPLDLRGTAFQLRVWQALRAVPPGRTASYTEIAAAIGAPRAVRAVAGACAANPVAVAVPCHRIVRGDGGLSGYRWGVERKRALLDREAAGRLRDCPASHDSPDHK